ncbi:MAG: phenylalanine--tRNA ligase subunit beta [Vicinamibacterales bacterium]
MKVLYSWLKDFVDVPDGPAEVGRRLSLRGLALESLEPVGAGEMPPGVAAVPDDAVLDFDVTANRPDCLSVLGIAREIATVYGLSLRTPGPDAAGHLRAATLAAADRTTFSVTLDAPDLCPRYVGAAATVTVGASPAWMQRRLQLLGVRPISNLVDITNYVLLEMGQPMHAFDHARIAGDAIVVRRARAGETLTTLDGKTRALAPSMLLIADADRGAAVGGVMGGLDSEVTATTTRIIFESAWFAPASVRATSKALGLRSEASTRFERGADPTAQARAMARACGLLTLIGAGTADGTMVDAVAAPFTPRTIAITAADIDGLLGMSVPAAEVTRILASLGCTLSDHLGGGWDVTVPGWRPDLVRPQDLVEEVGRHHGFEHLPALFPPVHQAPPPSDPRIARDAVARRSMLAMGFSEAISFAFVEAVAAEPFAGGQPLVTLANPLSETFAVMRPSVLPGVIDAVSHNRRHGRRDVRVFEIATAFGAAGERRALAAAWTGAAGGDHWSGGRRDVDAYDIVGAVEQLGAAYGVALTLDTDAPGYLVAGRAARVRLGDRELGVCGLLDPAIAERRGIPRADAADVYVLELDLDRVAAAAPPGAVRVVPLPRFPSVVRDVSVLVDDTLSAATVRDTMRRAAPSTLVTLREFDRYQGKGVPAGKVSVSLRLTFRADDRTLTDDEVSAAMTAVLEAARRQLGAEQR